MKTALWFLGAAAVTFVAGAFLARGVVAVAGAILPDYAEDAMELGAIYDAARP